MLNNLISGEADKHSQSLVILRKRYIQNESLQLRSKTKSNSKHSTRHG